MTNAALLTKMAQTIQSKKETEKQVNTTMLDVIPEPSAEISKGSSSASTSTEERMRTKKAQEAVPSDMLEDDITPETTGEMGTDMMDEDVNDSDNLPDDVTPAEDDTERTLAEAIASAAERTGMTSEEIVNSLREKFMGSEGFDALEQEISEIMESGPEEDEDPLAGITFDVIDIGGDEGDDSPDFITPESTDSSLDVPEAKDEDSEDEDEDPDDEKSEDEDKNEDKDSDKDAEDLDEDLEDEDSTDDEDEDDTFGKRSSVKIASLQDTQAFYSPNKVASKASWTVKTNGERVLRVFASQAYPSLDIDPETPSPIAGYPTYKHAFASEKYGKTLLATIKNSGLEKTASVCKGTLLTPKTAQMGMMQNSPANGAAAEAMNPSGGMTSPSLPPQENEGSPEGEDDHTLNPSEGAEEALWNSDDKETLPVTDTIGDRLAEDIANGVRSLEATLSEISALSDEDALSEFRGTLSQKVDSLLDSSSKSKEEDKDAEAAVTPETPETPGVPPADSAMPAGEPGNLPQSGGMPFQSSKEDTEEVETLKAKLAELQEEKTKLEKKAQIEQRFHAAKKFVIEELQPRGVVTSPNSLLAENPGMPLKTAQNLVNDAVIQAASDIVRMGESAASIYRKSMLNLPILSTDEGSDVDTVSRKIASRQGQLPLALGQTNDIINPLDIAFPESMFKSSSLLEIAKEHNEKKQKKRFYRG